MNGGVNSSTLEVGAKFFGNVKDSQKVAPRRPPIAAGEDRSETTASTEPSYNLRQPVWTTVTL